MVDLYPFAGAALDGADEDLRDAIAGAKMGGVSAAIREDLRDHAEAVIQLHRGEESRLAVRLNVALRERDEQNTRANKAAAQLAMADHRLKLAQEERDRMSERLQAALDERDDAEAARASAVAESNELRKRYDALDGASGQACKRLMDLLGRAAIVVAADLRDLEECGGSGDTGAIELRQLLADIGALDLPKEVE